jgi:hypothetical protein
MSEGDTAMTQTLEIQTPRPLTVDEQKKVQAFAVSLVGGGRVDVRGPGATHVNVDALLGMFAGLGGDKSDRN